MAIQKFGNHTPIIADSVFIDSTALVIGQVTLSEDVSVWPMVVIRGDMNFIQVGARTNIQDGSVLHVTIQGDYAFSDAPLIIGQEVTIGHGVMLHGCTIGNRCLIGTGATILDKAIISNHVIVGANSLVPPNKQLESGYLYFGHPVEQIRPLNEKDFSLLKYNADEYVTLKNQYLKDRSK